MPLEFPCSQCGKTLRTPDGSEGKQAKCPSCNTVMTVPSGLAPPASPYSPNLSPATPPPPNFGTNPFAEGAGAKGFGGAKPDFENPYAAPPLGTPLGGMAPGEAVDRQGPPWEQHGKSWNTFWETLKLVLMECERCFRQMRRTGGVGNPLLFAICGSYFGGAFAMVYNIIWNGGTLAMQQNAPPEAFLTLIGVSIAQFIFLPLAVAVSLFVSTAITHVLLLMLGGDRHGFEATFRVIAYVQGAAGVLQAIPCVGGLVAFVAVIVCNIIGLSQMHEISKGKAAAAVLLPMAICCGVILIFVVVVFGAVLAAANN